MPRSITSELDKNNPVQCVAFGEDGAWFYREAPRNGAKPYGEISSVDDPSLAIVAKFILALP